ncbi:MAG TPA: class I SAM-dependent methyltransferase [Longimicrobium sp.]|nr:class I SAM-dependent methyltransferase [Longimicrobium sp.]
MIRVDLHEENRRSWNAATVAHNSHKGDQAAFFRAGGSTLHPEEREHLGDVAGLDVVHLQCNAGQDTLSLAALGARVTGVDISDEAVAFARRLAADAGIDAAFERADVYEWLARAGAEGRRFDIVFVSYGALCWLSDLGTWAAGVAGVLRPGGRLVVVEFHPLAAMYDERMVLRWPYSSAGRVLTMDDGVGDYVAFSGDGLTPGEFQEGVRDFRNPHRSHEFAWGVGEVVQAILGAGLALETLREYPYSNGWRPWEGMRAEPGTRRFFPPEGIPDLPLMYAVVARQPE